jgi:hypothetical protein
VAVDVRQRRIGVEVAALRRGLENAFGGVLENAAVAPHRLAQHFVGGHAV